MDIRSVLLLRVSSLVDKDVAHPQFFDPPYPLKYIQAGLSTYSHLDVHLIDCWVNPLDVSQLLDRAAGMRPDLIVISTSSFDIDIANEFVDSLKKRKDAPLVVGIGQGHYLNRDANKVDNSEYDAILLGEPEQEFFRLFDWMRSNDASDGQWKDHYQKCYAEGKRFIIEDLDRLPFPSYTPDELRIYKSIHPVQMSQRVVWGFLISTRGCPYGCMFCSEVMRVSTGTKIRSRSATNVADEMEHLGRQGVNICSFQDDSFSTNRRFVKSLCEELISRKSKMAWMARVRVDEVDYDSLELMKKAGCVLLGLGVESGSQRIIDEMRKTLKPTPWLDLCRQTLRWTRKLGIGTLAYYVIGNPTETREEIEQTIRFSMELNSDIIQVHYYTPYPGSAAWERYKDQLSAYDPTRLYHYATPMFSLADVSVEELEKLRSEFYRRYLFRPAFAINHLWRHAGFYFHNPGVFWSLLGVRKIL
jgi:radical SAM superfamily enzyme YgiQ (UPF0313 family)